MSDPLGSPQTGAPGQPSVQPAPPTMPPVPAFAAAPAGYAPQGYAQPGYPPQAGYPAPGNPPQPGYPQQGYGYPGQPFNVNVSSPTIVIAPPSGPGFGVRAIWFIFVGWWLTGFMIGLAYFLAITIIGLPAAFYLFNRIPVFLTLRGRSKTYRTTMSPDGTTQMLQAVNVEQRPMLHRAFWFIFLGWWVGGLWMALAYVLCLTILGLPIGLMMFDRTGGVMTLLKY